MRDTALALYDFAAEYARQRGIIIADTKFEFGVDADGRLTLIDEVLTPDSSRFWPADTYRAGISPPSFDKQFVRDYLETLDWNKKAPGPKLPAEIIARTSDEVPRGAARASPARLQRDAGRLRHGDPLDRPVDPVGRLRAARRGGRRRAGAPAPTSSTST